MSVVVTTVFARIHGRISLVGPPDWYESFYLPVFVACIVFVALWFVRAVPLLDRVLEGLVLTAPPYVWFILRWLDVGGVGQYLNQTSYPLSAENRDGLWGLAGLILLALSGAVLSPLIYRVVQVGRGGLRRQTN